ncbi:hypothetical protein L6452_19839 [Arctium lappa]|uniref:Uncharacterized protein n=1 Tax=Arctium lappa TaxID=4217 RepID=A0ACB9B997_ARCLA|nr:hypothetical protein L6452_19839 [Arctium lappa]
MCSRFWTLVFLVLIVGHPFDNVKVTIAVEKFNLQATNMMVLIGGGGTGSFLSNCRRDKGTELGRLGGSFLGNTIWQHELRRLTKS